MKYLLAHEKRLLMMPEGEFLFSAQSLVALGLTEPSRGAWQVDPDHRLLWLNTRPEMLIELPLRALLGEASTGISALLARAQQLLNWRESHQFCGRCRGALSFTERELALACADCGAVSYPRISPCVIVLIEDGDRILLGHNVRFTPNRFSTFAGFIEAGESAERAVRREIAEEVGVELGELRYFMSQPWPFPDSLMLGFFAQYRSGAIRPDGEEIIDARWFTAEQLTQVVLPPEHAISAQLILNWLERQKSSVRPTFGA